MDIERGRIRGRSVLRSSLPHRFAAALAKPGGQFFDAKVATYDDLMEVMGGLD